jgi:hypothetical protein
VGRRRVRPFLYLAGRVYLYFKLNPQSLPAKSSRIRIEAHIPMFKVDGTEKLDPFGQTKNNTIHSPG